MEWAKLELLTKKVRTCYLKLGIKPMRLQVKLSFNERDYLIDLFVKYYQIRSLEEDGHRREPHEATIWYDVTSYISSKEGTYTWRMPILGLTKAIEVTFLCDEYSNNISLHSCDSLFGVIS